MRKNKYLDPFRLHFLSARGFVTEAILEMKGERFSKRDLLNRMYGKLSQSSVGSILSELKYAGILTGIKEGRSYFYEINNKEGLLSCRESTIKLPHRTPYTPNENVSLCLACEGTTIDVASSEMRGRPLICQECNGDGINDWISDITRDTSDWI
jgi:DNA-binding transcriptional ArsR family regulator